MGVDLSVKKITQAAWIKQKVNKFSEGASHLAKLSITYPQQAYAASTNLSR